jgi:hypothetical protein
MGLVASRQKCAREIMKIRVGLSVPVKDDGTGYGPTVRLTRRLEQNGWGAAVERAEVCVAGGSDGWEDAKLGAEEKPKQASQEEAGGGDLLPEMDRADPLRSGPRRTLRLLRIGIRSRTRKQEPEETAERSDITVVVWVWDQEEEADGQQHERRRDATPDDASVPSFPCYHAPRLRSCIQHDARSASGLRAMGQADRRCVILQRERAASSPGGAR